MTESEWLSCQEPQAMLAFLRATGRLSERKGFLLAAACFRRIMPLLTDQDRGEAVVEAAERWADAAAKDRAAPEGSWMAVIQEHIRDVGVVAEAAMRVAADAAVNETAPYEGDRPWWRRPVRTWFFGRGYEPGRPGGQAEQAAQCTLLRDLFGFLLFRPVTLSPSLLQWNSGLVVRLAQTAYDTRRLPAGTLEPERLAVLADALEEAGCDDPDILGHLRGPRQAHVRGCWLLDLLLARG